MSATDELRKLLDECGVEWACHGYENHTWWNGSGVFGWHAENRPSVNGSFVKIGAVITPEQAIAATLGSGECEIETTESWLPAERYHRCKHCGAFFAVMDASGDIPPCVCPNCGRKAVDE